MLGCGDGPTCSIPDGPHPPFDRLIPHLAGGGLLLYVTETVWGVGCDPDHPDAVEALRRAKGTPIGQPYSMALAEPSELEVYGRLTSLARKLAREFLPGPLTLIVPLRSRWQTRWRAVAGTGVTIGLRCPLHPLTRKLLELAGPLVSTSANHHGQPSLASLQQLRHFAAALEASTGHEVPILNGPPEPGGQPSTVIDVASKKPKVLRWGVLGPESLGGYLPG